MDKRGLSERDICSKFIGPAVKRASWDGMLQVREEVAFNKRADHGLRQACISRRGHPPVSPSHSTGGGIALWQGTGLRFIG